MTSNTTGAKLATSLDVFDTLSLFKVQERVGERGATDHSPARMNYEELLDVCERLREKHEFDPADATIAPMAVDLRSDNQTKFVDALRHMGIVTDPIDFRWTYASRNGGDPHEREERSVSTLSASLSYLLGLIAGRAQTSGKSPQILLVTGSFDVYRSLLDFVNVRKGRALIAFFRSFLDHRWAAERVFDDDSPIEFADLEPFAEDLLGVKIEGGVQHGSDRPRGGLESI